MFVFKEYELNSCTTNKYNILRIIKQLNWLHQLVIISFPPSFLGIQTLSPP